jgi:hypothetical protein
MTVKYFTAPIYSLHNVSISKVSIIRDLGNGTCSVSFEGKKAPDQIVDEKYLFETFLEATEKLAWNILQFKDTLDKRFDKVIKKEI